jgi:DNA-binding transcriptional regulator YiaG
MSTCDSIGGTARNAPLSNAAKSECYTCFTYSAAEHADGLVDELGAGRFSASRTIPSTRLSRRPVATRDSRMASCGMSFGTLPRHTGHLKSSRERLPARLRAWRKRNDFSQSEAALHLQISKRTLQEWEQGRAKPRGLASAAIERAVRGKAAR